MNNWSLENAPRMRKRNDIFAWIGRCAFFCSPLWGSMTVRLSRRVKVSLVVTVSNTPAKQYMRAHSGRREIASIFFTCQLTLFILTKTSKIRNKAEQHYISLYVVHSQCQFSIHVSHNNVQKVNLFLSRKLMSRYLKCYAYQRMV